MNHIISKEYISGADFRGFDIQIFYIQWSGGGECFEFTVTHIDTGKESKLSEHGCGSQAGAVATACDSIVNGDYDHLATVQLELSNTEIHQLTKCISRKNMKLKKYYGNMQYKSLLDKGYLEIIKHGKTMHTMTITRAGMLAYMTVPDDYTSPAGYYPLPRDVHGAKAKIVETGDIADNDKIK
jgi:hypothetical protein